MRSIDDRRRLLLLMMEPRYWWWHLRSYMCDRGWIRCSHCREAYVDRARTIPR